MVCFAIWVHDGARQTDAVLYVYIKCIMVECNEVILVENFFKNGFHRRTVGILSRKSFSGKK